MNLYLILALIGGVIYLLNKYFHSYWARKNVFFVEPKFFIGNLAKVLTFKKNPAEFFNDVYENFKNKKIVGAYFFYQPVLIVNDTELIQDVMIRSFTSFHDRPMPDKAAENYPLIGHLFNVRGQKWRDLRVKLSPTFTSGKIKAMFPIINDCADVLFKYVDKNIDNGNDIFEFRDLFARLTTNIISNIAFGIDNDCINDRENYFRKMGIKMMEPSMRNALIGILFFFAPDLLVKSKINPLEKDVDDFIFSMVRDTVNYREKNKVERNDFLQLLIKLKNEGYIPVDKGEKNEYNKHDIQNEQTEKTKLSFNDLAANVFLFFIAGEYCN